MKDKEWFFQDRRERDARCRQKDGIICPILESISIPHPSKFRTLLMPCLHAPELKIFGRKGVPPTNMWAIERNHSVWKKINAMRGLHAGPRPMDADEAIDFIDAENPEKFNVIYLDFFGRPGFKHLELFQKIFALRMVRPGGKLILTFGKTRSRMDVRELNEGLLAAGGLRHVPTQKCVRAALELTEHPPAKRMYDRAYQSYEGSYHINYVTTVVEW